MVGSNRVNHNWNARHPESKSVQHEVGRTFAWVSLLGGVYLIMSQTAIATATSDDTIRPYVGTSLSYDNNLLRLSDDVSAQQAAGKNTKADFIKQIRAGMDVDWQISRQHLVLKANVNQNWFETYSELDYLGYDILSQWNWSVGSNLQGELGYSNKVTLGSFAQLNQLVSNSQTVAKYFANGSYQVMPGLYVHGGFSHDDLSYSASSRQVSNRSEDTGVLGIKYLNAKKNLLGIKVNLTQGSYPKRGFNNSSILDNGYSRKSYELDWAWTYSIKTRLDGNIGYTHQDYDHLSIRNFDSLTAHGNIYWEATGKTSFVFSAWRDIVQAETLTSSFMLRQGFRLTPSWSATPKVQLSMPISYEQQDYLGESGLVLRGATVRQDEVVLVGLNAGYKPMENTELSVVTQYEDRSSNNPFRSYTDISVGMNLQVNF